MMSQLPPPPAVRFLAKLVEKTYQPGGENCITQGEENDTFFVIKSGNADVMQTTNQVRADCVPGITSAVMSGDQ
jgi:CRP-like cAMP-binding protein